MSNIYGSSPIRPYSESSLNILEDTSIKLKELFKDTYKIESQFGIFDEKTNQYVEDVNYE